MAATTVSNSMAMIWAPDPQQKIPMGFRWRLEVPKIRRLSFWRLPLMKLLDHFLFFQEFCFGGHCCNCCGEKNVTIYLHHMRWLMSLYNIQTSFLFLEKTNTHICQCPWRWHLGGTVPNVRLSHHNRHPHPIAKEEMRTHPWHWTALDEECHRKMKMSTKNCMFL